MVKQVKTAMSNGLSRLSWLWITEINAGVNGHLFFLLEVLGVSFSAAWSMASIAFFSRAHGRLFSICQACTLFTYPAIILPEYVEARCVTKADRRA